MISYLNIKTRNRTRNKMQTDYSLKWADLINQLKDRHCDNGTSFQHIACLVQQCEKQGYEEPNNYWI